MGQILHKCARTTEAIRKEIQDSKEGIMSLAKKYGINHKTVIKWKKRDFVHDAKMGTKDPYSTVLTNAEEAVEAFRKHDRLYKASSFEQIILASFVSKARNQQIT